jgi:hypothetical protein
MNLVSLGQVAKTLHPGEVRTRDLLLTKNESFSLKNFGILFSQVAKFRSIWQHCISKGSKGNFVPINGASLSTLPREESTVARFFLSKYTKLGKNIPNYHNIT